MPTEQEIKINTIDAWKQSRSGAWASRGFHYQHLLSMLILIRQWAGLSPSGYLVPEGLEDSVIELPTRELWLQIKSRKKGTFSETEVQKILASVDEKASSIQRDNAIQTSLILEQPCPDIAEVDIDRLFEGMNERVFVCASPAEESISILTEQLGVAEIIAENIVNDLYKLVASASEENASLAYSERRRISTTEVEHRIFERMEAENPSAIDHALVVGNLEPVNFNSPINEPAFYQGVKVTPGHVAAGLVIERSTDRRHVIRELRRRRHVLLCGPSGAGKSALLWSSVHELAGEIRWYQITAQAVASGADAIALFIRARRPSEISPIGLAFDDIGSVNADLWDVLVRELRGLPSVYFLGSVRKEDVSLISNQADTEFIEVSLNESFAESVWQKLHAENQTSWEHWREPLEQSDWLMLEYVHILTQGKRLSAVIGDQIRQRQQEERHNELAVIRTTAVLCARGGEVQAEKLFGLLGMKRDIASQALARLIDEHLVRETRPGVMGGLHLLRSQALSQASHDQTVYLSDDSLWQGLLTVTNETLPQVIQSILADVSGEDEVATLLKLSEILSGAKEIDTWIAILTGLGLATLDRNVFFFIDVLNDYGIQRAQWALASIFSDPHTDIPELTGVEQWQSFRDAILAFRDLPKHDLRNICLDKLPEGCALPPCQTLQQANKLLACLSPICGGESMHLKIPLTFVGKGILDIKELTPLLSAAYLISPNIAKEMVDELGGEEMLLHWFQSQTPWVTTPKIDPKGEHGRTVRSDMFYLDEQGQVDPHESVCDICETLIAISPESDAAASDVVTPMGLPLAIGEYRPWSKNMPRKNIPAKARVAWNVAFRQIMLARSTSDNLTEYTRQMTELVIRTEKVFRSFTEKWVKGKRIANVGSLAKDIDEITNATNALAYATPEKAAYEMTIPPVEAGQEDSLGALLTGVLGNLLPRMLKIPGEVNPKAAAAFAGSLASQARDHEQSGIWRTSPKPPLRELSVLAERLSDVACVLHELAVEDGQLSFQGVIKSTKTSNLGKALRTAARNCSFLADQRFNRMLKSLEIALKKKGWDAKCWARSVKESDSPYWPPNEVAIAVNIQDFETDAEYIEDALSLGAQHIGNNWRFRIVPIINDFVLAPLALLPSSNMPLPDQDFTKEWQEHIELPFFSPQVLNCFDEGLAACLQLSAIVNCRNLEELHPEEEKSISSAMETFNRSRNYFDKAAENSDSEYLAWACDYLNGIWNQVVDEFDEAKAGKTVTEPLCISPHLALSGEENDQASEIAGARILLLQDECIRVSEGV